jgi:deoxyribonuclease V
MDLTIHHQHSWEVSGPQARAIQDRLATLVLASSPLGPIRTVAGIDVSFPNADRARAAIVVLSYPDQEPLAQVTADLPVSFPYVPGLLSFREIPAVLAAMRSLPEMPDILICDGHGRAHFRRLGLASHLGVLLDHPTVGCAKSRLVGTHTAPGDEKGSFTWLNDGAETLGAVLRTRSGVRPVYVSVGHRIDLDSALDVVLTCAVRYRLPEPTRLAHLVAGGARLAPEA